jgi:hypothetical protein
MTATQLANAISLPSTGDLVNGLPTTPKVALQTTTTGINIHAQLVVPAFGGQSAAMNQLPSVRIYVATSPLNITGAQAAVQLARQAKFFDLPFSGVSDYMTDSMFKAVTELLSNGGGYLYVWYDCPYVNGMTGGSLSIWSVETP